MTEPRTLDRPSGRSDTTIIKTEIVGTYITHKTARSAAIEYALKQSPPGSNTEIISAWPIEGRGRHGSYHVWAVEVKVNQ